MIGIIPQYPEADSIVMNQEHRQLKSIRSFIIRGGRLTRGQQIALDKNWPEFGLEIAAYQDEKLQFDKVFELLAPTILEIGFGDGEALLEVAKNNPDKNYLGIEVHRPGVGHLLMELDKQGLNNVRIFCEDAVEVISLCIEDNSLERICLFFPDPWPKKKHHKRRLIQVDFVAMVAKKLTPGGVFHFATDWQEYAEVANEKIEASGCFKNVAGAGMFSPRPDDRPLTKFEKRGQRLGHGVWDIVMEKQ